jgi:phosphoglycerol transferase MdoB-like AlkP superfamily enzyme
MLLVLRALITGVRFDITISAYLLILPFLVIFFDNIAQISKKSLRVVAAATAAVSYIGTMFVCAGDLPYMHHFHNRVHNAVFISFSNGGSDFLTGMVFQEWRYYWAFAPFFLSSWLIVRKALLFYRLHLTAISSNGRHGNLSGFLLGGLLLVFAMWNNLSFKEPIHEAQAYTSDYSFTNQLGLNPAFVFYRSLITASQAGSHEVHFMDNEEALNNVRKVLNVPDSNGFDSPIARSITFENDKLPIKPNIVLVIMESMSANKMSRFGNKDNLTPYIDSLAERSLTFDSVFSSGIHTFAGIYSVLFSQPVIKSKHSLLEITPQAGLTNSLKNHGYSTVYFTTHDADFDNVGPFLNANGFDKIVSKCDYPEEQVMSSLGVPDDYLYEHAIKVLDEMQHKAETASNPFFATIMTGSDHGPYIIPDYFTPKHKKSTLAIVEYVDWSVRKFMAEASEKPWYDNTLFIFVADHGAPTDKRYDLPLSFLHIPIIMYGPKVLGESRVVNELTSQLDLYPTLMGLLRLSYVNNGFGMDVLKDKRPFVFAFADNKYAVLDKQYMYLWREKGLLSLYDYKSNDIRNHLPELKELAGKMKYFGESMFQAAQWLRKNGYTTP